MRSAGVLALGLAVAVARLAGQQLVATERAEVAAIVAVQGVPAESWIRDSVLPETSAATPTDRWQRAVQWMLQGEKGTTINLLVRLPGGAQRGISVTRSVSLNDRWPLERPDIEIDSFPGGVVVTRVNALAEEDVVRRFDRAFPDFAGVTGLIVDLRHAAGGVIIGETSAGSPGDALTIALPKNWAMQLSVTRHTFPNGEEFAGKGIQPELTVSATVADVQAGTDAVLERAREYVSGKKR